MSALTPRDLRRRAGRTLQWLSDRSGASVPTIRLFEAAASSVRPRKRAAIAKVYEQIAREDLGIRVLVSFDPKP